MVKIVKAWMNRYFADEEALLLLLLLAAGFTVVLTMGTVLAPMIASVIFAYLMQGIVNRLRNYGLPHWVAVTSAFSIFVFCLIGFLVFMLPLLGRQITRLASELPVMLNQWKQSLLLLVEEYPEFISQDQLQQIVQSAGTDLGSLGQSLVSFSVSSVPALITALIYLILVPILVFFFLKDGEKMLSWWASFLPQRRPIMTQVWSEMNLQVANYVRGKVIELLVVGIVSIIAFYLLGLQYALLLGLLVGLSVIVPYIGAAVVTIPVLLIGVFQWGWSPEFWWLMAVYGVIQALDGNVLVPLLFSEVNKLHPVVIILAVLVFGGLWGFWGVFFAIPLATLVKAVFSAWPRDIAAIEDSTASVSQD